MVACPYCAEDIREQAKVCKHCGLDLATGTQAGVSAPKEWQPGVAAILSLVIPGAGQIYKGQIANGLFWMFITILGYALFVFPGLILHIICIAGAYSGDPNKTGYAT